jgi:hypothetical protein
MSHWVFDPISLACLLASGALYVAGISRLWARAGRGCGVRPWQLGAFAAGWIALVVALLSPVAAISDVLFSVHMTQHEILILVAAPLLVLGRPIVPSLWALTPRWRLRAGTWSRNRYWSASAAVRAVLRSSDADPPSLCPPQLARRVALRTLAAFLVTFGVLRAITAVIHYELFPHGPFRNLVTKSGLHIHHLFWGILLLMITGFVALATRDPKWHLRTAVVFGIALGLTLDAFAMWLRLADVYWSPDGVESLKAGAVAAAVLALYGFGQPFWHAIVKDALRPTA